MRNRDTFALSVAAMALATPAISSAQDDELHGPPSETLVGGPISSSDRAGFRGASDVEADVQLSSEDESVEADFELTFAFAGEPTRHVVGDIDYLNGSFWSGSIKANVPLGEGKEPEVDFRNFGVDGSLSLSINHYSPHFVSSEGLNRFLGPMAVQCARYAGAKWISDNAVVVDELALESSLASFATQYERRMGEDTLAPWDDFLIPWGAYKTEFASDPTFKPADAFEDVYNAIVRECKAGDNKPIGNTRDIIYYFQDNFPNDDTFIAYRKAVTPDSANFFGLEGSVGLSRFNLLDRANFEVVDEDEVGFDLNAHGGWIFNNANTAFRIGGGYTRTFEAQDEVEFCQPLGTGGEQKCIDGDDGAPTREDTAYAEIGIRHILDRDRDGSPTMAIAPSVTYIVEDDDFQFDVPLYLQRDEKSGLDAGVIATYNTGKDEVAFGVFIGVPFNLTAR